MSLTTFQSTEEAFRHCLEHKAKDKYPYKTVRSWNRRMENGELKEPKMQQILEECGYTMAKKLVVWKLNEAE